MSDIKINYFSNYELLNTRYWIIEAAVTKAGIVLTRVCVCVRMKVYVPHNDQLDARIFPTMHFPHNVSLVRMGVSTNQKVIL